MPDAGTPAATGWGSRGQREDPARRATSAVSPAYRGPDFPARLGSRGPPQNSLRSFVAALRQPRRRRTHEARATRAPALPRYCTALCIGYFKPAVCGQQATSRRCLGEPLVRSGGRAAAGARVRRRAAQGVGPARAKLALRGLTRGGMSERSERSERSEFCSGPRDSEQRRGVRPAQAGLTAEVAPRTGTRATASPPQPERDTSDRADAAGHRQHDSGDVARRTPATRGTRTPATAPRAAPAAHWRVACRTRPPARPARRPG